MTLLNVSDSSIDKALFAKISPRKLASLTAHSGNIRVVATSDFVETIEFKSSQGYTVTRVLTYAELNTNGQWYWDRENALLYVYCSAALPYEIIIIISLFVTTTFDVLAPSDPDDSGNYDRIVWRNRLQETSFSQSAEDQLNGKLGISSTNISLINNDSYYNYLADDSVSFKGAKIKVWVVINIFDNRLLIFTGSCESASFSGSSIVLDVKENIKNLQKLPKFSDVETEYSISTSRFGTDILDDIVGDPIPFILGRLTSFDYKKIKQTLKYKPIAENVPDKVCINPTSVEYYSDVFESNDIDSNDCVELKVINRENATFDSTNVRCAKFVGFRSVNNIIASFNYAVTYSAIVDKRSEAATTNYFGGDVVVTLSDVSKNFIGQYASLYYSNSSTYSGDPFGGYRVSDIDFVNKKVTISASGDIKISKNRFSYTYTFAVFSGFRTFYSDADVPVGVTNKTTVYNEANADGTYTTFFQIHRYAAVYDLGYLDQYFYIGSDSKKILRGGVIDQYTELNSSTIELKDVPFFAKALTENTNCTLGAMLHFTLKKAGFDTDGGSGLTLTESTSSFKHLDTKLGDTYFTLKSTDSNTYLGLIEKMLSSIFGFLYVQNSGKIGIRLFENVPYGTNTFELSEDDIKDKSVSSNFDCSSIYTRLKSKGGLSKYTPIVTNSDSLSLLSGETEKEDDFYIESNSIYEAKIQNRKFSFCSNPIKKYTFTVINKGYEMTLGDKITLNFDNSGKWLGSNTTKDLFIISINKSLSGVIITAIENNFPSI